jgi:L-asparaginase
MNYKIVNLKTRTTGTPEASVLIIYSGGTVGMQYDAEGALVPFNFGSIKQQIPQLKEYNFRLTVISFPVPVDSSNMDADAWSDLAYIIYENYHQYDGFVVLHGTDTMAYTASAISFMLKGLRKPVIFTGSQLPIGAMRSDARENLFTAIEIAADKENGVAIIQDVCIFFSSKLMRGNRAKKIRSSQFSAFDSENYPDLAHAGIQIMYNQAYLRECPADHELELQAQMNKNVFILKIYPNLCEPVLKTILGIPALKGLIIETYGSGNAMTAPWFIDSLHASIKAGLVVLNVSQCPGGNVIQGRYETSKHLSRIGVVSGRDMTTEAAVTKMMYLFGQSEDPAWVTTMLNMSLAGEIT